MRVLTVWASYTLSLISVFVLTDCIAKLRVWNLHPVLFTLNCRVIRLTSPKLNYLVIIGSVLMYLSVFIELLPTTQEAVYHSLCAVSITVSSCSVCHLQHTFQFIDPCMAILHWIPCGVWDHTGKNVEGLPHIS